jgi:electron transport complex protein RnfB
MRSLPINREIAVKWPVAPYEDVLEILEKQETVAVAPSICRSWMKLAEKGCDKPVETCFMFGSHARSYVENEMGRDISKEEARKDRSYLRSTCSSISPMRGSCIKKASRR